MYDPTKTEALLALAVRFLEAHEAESHLLNQQSDPEKIDDATYFEAACKTSRAGYEFRAALSATGKAPVALAEPIEDPVTVPRGLLGAACAAIERKHDAPKTLEQLRRYTVGDLSAPAGPTVR